MCIDVYTRRIHTHGCIHAHRLRAYIDTHAFRQDKRIRVHGRVHIQNMCVYVYVVYLHDYTEAFAFQIN